MLHVYRNTLFDVVDTVVKTLAIFPVVGFSPSIDSNPGQMFPSRCFFESRTVSE